MDRMWWHAHSDDIDGDFELWTSAKHVADVFGLNWISSEPGGGISKLPGTIRQGGNSGFQAVGLALHFGAERIILLGFDMQFTAGRTHWHGDHKGKMGNPVQKRMDIWRRNFAELAEQAPVPILNASRATALECFPRVTLEEALCGHG